MNVLVRPSEKPAEAFSKAQAALHDEGKNIDPKSIMVIKGRELKSIGKKNDSQGAPKIFLFENRKVGTVQGFMALFGRKLPGIDSYTVQGMEIIFLTK